MFNVGLNRRLICRIQIHFVHKNKRRYAVSLQQLPKGDRMSLHPVFAADYKYRIVQHLQCSLHLCREIHMTGSIQKQNLSISPLHYGLLGKDGDSPRPFLTVRIKESTAVIHSSQLSYGTGTVQQSFR